jgi:hypothetical protein
VLDGPFLDSTDPFLDSTVVFKIQMPSDAAFQIPDYRIDDGSLIRMAQPEEALCEDSSHRFASFPAPTGSPFSSQSHIWPGRSRFPLVTERLL